MTAIENTLNTNISVQYSVASRLVLKSEQSWQQNVDSVVLFELSYLYDVMVHRNALKCHFATQHLLFGYHETQTKKYCNLFRQLPKMCFKNNLIICKFYCNLNNNQTSTKYIS